MKKQYAMTLGKALCLLASTLTVAGCSLDFKAGTSLPAAGFVLSGHVHGGNQVVSGSNLYLYAAGVGGYGTAARSMLSAPGFVTSDATGTFTITGTYTCQPGDQVYLLAVGGNPGLAAGANNSALMMAAALGACSALTPSTFINVNEVTTVAAAYALAGFMSSPTQLSSSGSTLAQVGVANAFRSANNLASTFSGTSFSITPARNGTVPAAEINTLANILASCVNSSGNTPACSSLFAAARSTGGATPADTFQAMLNIAHSPGTNVNALFQLSTANQVFQPSLTAAPHDWSLAVIYTGGGMSRVSDGHGNTYVPNYGLAIDPAGNVWVANLQSVTELDPTGAPLSPAAGFTSGLSSADGVFSLAIDSLGDAWVGVGKLSGVGYRVLALSLNGGLLSPSAGYSGGGIATHGAEAIAFDPSGNLWAAGALNGSGGAVAKLNAMGQAISPASGYAAPGGFGPFGPGIVSDTSGKIWAGSFEFSQQGALLSSSFACAGDGSDNNAIDHAGNFWVGTYVGNGSAIMECNSAGTQVSNGFPTGISESIYATAVDGDGRIWYIGDSGSVGAISSTGAAISPASGYRTENSPNYMALDGSGNMWTATESATVLELVGIASPVVTPIAAGVALNQLGVRP